MEFLVLLFFAFLWAFVASAMARSRNRSAGAWFWGTVLFLGILGPIILLFLGTVQKPTIINVVQNNVIIEED